MDYSMKNRTYRYFEGKPLYPFGYGLSYSKFEYSNLKVSANELKAGDPLSVDVDVKNANGPTGDEVVQLYLGFPKTPGAPLRALRAFTRVHVDAGKTQHVHFTSGAARPEHGERSGRSNYCFGTPHGVCRRRSDRERERLALTARSR